MTSCDNRMVVDTFGRAFGGRPRRTGALTNLSGQPSVERSGAVSESKPRVGEPSFSFIGGSYADNPAHIVSGCPGAYHHRLVQKRSELATGLPIIHGSQHRAIRPVHSSCHVRQTLSISARFDSPNSMDMINVTTEIRVSRTSSPSRMRTLPASRNMLCWHMDRFDHLHTTLRYRRVGPPSVLADACAQPAVGISRVAQWLHW